MDSATSVLLCVLIFAAALLYASVGHAGGSGYLAAMALVGVAPPQMKASALVLNVLVAVIATTKFARAGCFSWRLFWPFAIASVPLAFVGGWLNLPGQAYKIVVGTVLLFAAYRLIRTTRQDDDAPRASVSLAPALSAGAVIGLLSGITGVGGGIFLSPLLLFLGWAETRESAGVSAAFILVNSLAALIGQVAGLSSFPAALPAWAAAAVVGGWIGADYGSRRLGSVGLRRLLAVVLVIAGLKMIFT